ncbi:MAG: hypothetical protein GY868_08590, partial [Deltaproteobacteria bacterium]|nr:hypothetical protein [Deltaproteobacteria bacterium]
MSLKGTLFLIGLLLWLGLAGVFISRCPKFISSGKLIVFNDFEKAESIVARQKQLTSISAPNAQRAVVWEEAGGFGGTAGARLGVHDQLKSFLAWDLDDPGRFSFLELRGRLRTDSLVRGERPWRSARLILYFKDSQGRKHWDYPHSVANLTGSSDWQGYVKSFQVPEFAESA